jgi:hypothetical protein
MPKQVRLRRGTTAQHAVFAGALGEVTFDTDKSTLVCHDGSTLGGRPLGGEVFVPVINTGRLVWVDDHLGDDATGQRERISHPFKTLTAAKNAAIPLDTIMVLPGNYNEKNLFKSGVNWHFYNGAQVITNSPTAGGIFDDSPAGANADIICRITGHGEFINNSTDVLSYAFMVSRAGSKVTFEASHVGSGTRGCVRFTGGTSRLRATTILSGAAGVELVGGTNEVRVDSIKASTGAGIVLGGGTNVVVADTIHSDTLSGILAYGGTSEVSARLIESNGTHGVKLFFVSDPVELRINGARIVTTVFAVGVRAVQIEGVDGPTLKDCVLVSSLAAAESIYANAPTDVRLYGSTMTNKPKHADVTFVTGGSRFEVDAAVD